MIIVNIDVMLAKNKMSVSDLTEKLGLTLANVSLLKMVNLKELNSKHWISCAKFLIVNHQIY